jgi:tRNA (guanine37-N1)-methyltransferase
MRCEVLTLFPGIVEAALGDSIMKRATDAGLIEIKTTDIRSYTRDKHNQADDYPFGGGPGMVMKPEPVFEAVEAIKSRETDARVIFLTPRGRRFDHEMALELSREDRVIVFVCGRYEGIDERAVTALADDELSIGDYVLSGGELAACVVIEASARLVPGVLGHEGSAPADSFYEGLLDYPHYTRPAEYRDMKVPDVLIGGNHELIRIWRRRQSLIATMLNRPDLLDKAALTDEDIELMAEIEAGDEEK